MKTRFSLVGLVIGIVLLFAGECDAATRTVNSLNDSGAGTLRDTIAASNDGDSINFSVTGAINLTSGTLTIAKNITINGPGASSLEVTRTAGVFGIFFITSSSTVTIAGIAITNGHGLYDGTNFHGGGITNNGVVTINNCTISGNTADPDGGGVSTNSNNTNSSANLTANSCTFSNNSALEGGAIDVNNSHATLNYCTFSSNHATSDGGGAILNFGNSTLTADHCTFSQNDAHSEGGALFNFGSAGSPLNATVRNSTFTSNTTSNGGGGAICNFVELMVSNCTFVNNGAHTTGGGVENYTGALTMRNCTLAGNSAATGGGVYNEGSGNGFTANANVSSSTFSNNSASNGGGIYNTGTNSGNAFVTLSNTILFSTNATPGANLVQVGSGTSITSQGYNLSSDNGGGFLTATGDQINTDPKLGPLQNNNGPVQTMALLDGSPAWDKGKNFGITTDARGLPRPFDVLTLANATSGDGSDIGAVEMQGAPSFVVTTTVDHDDGVCDGTDCTLREAINAANAAAGADAITFKSGVKGTITLQSGLGTLTVNDSVTITGPGARALSVSGGNAIRVFTFNNGTNAVSGLNIINGRIAAPSDTEAAGGGVYNAVNKTLSISDCNFSGNSVQGGNSSLLNNTGPGGFGGAIENVGTLTLDRCTLSNNTAQGGIGGPGSGAVNGNPVAGDGGGGHGGAIFNEIAGHLTINNCTISANSALGGKGGDHGAGQFGGNGGGAVASVSNAGTATVTGCTFNNNTGAGGAGGTGSNQLNGGRPGAGLGGLGNNGSTTVKSTIIAGNLGTGSNDSSKDIDGPFTSGGYNLIGSTGTSSGFSATGDQSGTDAAPLNAVLGSLQNNGGKTDTLALLTNSPAINASNVSVAPARDQRNYVRAGTPDKGAFEFNGKVPETLANISTRAFVLTGDNVMIGGFVISGTGAKKVIIRARGPSLPGSVANRLQDPTLELHTGSSTIATNDNWVDAVNHQEISDSGFAPSNNLESAILMTLNPGAYTAIVSGVNSGVGVGIIEGFDLDHSTGSRFGDISTRAYVQTGDNVMIGGFVVTGPDSDTVVVRATGPSLTQFGVANAMQDPTLELHDSNGNTIATNDNWEDTQQAQIQASGFAPSNVAESAILQTLAPGGYTAIVQGKNGTVGVAVVEVYGLN